MVRQYHELVTRLLESKYTVAFTGAGISTASGIPDYRGPNGIWTLKEQGKSIPKPEKPWYKYEPNPAHIALKQLIDQRYINHLISQNVDGLHLKSGIPENKISELHGNSTIMRCTYCESSYHRENIGWKREYGRGRLDEEIHPDQPVCLNCGGRIVSTVVDFGDPLPKKVIERARTESIKSSLFLVLGSSLAVSPASSFPKIAKKYGANVIIINQGKTEKDDIAEIKIEDDLSFLLPKVVEILKNEKRTTHKS